MRPIGQRPQQQPEELPLGQRKLQASPLLRDERALPPQRALYFQVWLRMEGLEKPRKPPRSKEQARTSRIDHLLAVSYDACSSPLRPSRRAKLASANSKLHLVWPCRTSNYKACFCATLSSKVRRVVLTAKLASEWQLSDSALTIRSRRGPVCLRQRTVAQITEALADQ